MATPSLIFEHLLHAARASIDETAGIMITIENFRKRKAFFQQAKPFTLHCSLLFVVMFYSYAGGMIFYYLEHDVEVQMAIDDKAMRARCVHEVFDNATALSYKNYKPTNATITLITQCFHVDIDPRNQWSQLTAVFYSFGIATTLGYNRLQPITLEGRMFCLIYGICGIPITMIIIANVGQYLHQFASSFRKNIEARRKRRRPSKANITDDDIPDQSIEATSLALVGVFLLYVAFGAFVLPLLNGELDFVNGLYYNFITLTAIDFGHIVPNELKYWPVTFLYICFGLGITTIAIDVGAQYMKKLHNLGQKMKNVAQTKIWFGGKTLKVRDLLHAVGKKCGIDPHVIDNLDLENVVERTIAINEGKEPPADTNDDPPAPPQEPQPTRDENDNISMKPPSEACPLLSRTSVRSKLSTISMPRRDLVIQNPTIMTPSISESPMEIYIPPMFSEHEIAAIDMDDPEEEPVMYFVNPIVATHYSPLVVPPQSDIAMPADLAPAAPIMVFEDAEAIKQMRRNTLSRTPSPDASSLEPKKFKEKREKYGRDPRKLYETYQEEWDRLERLSDRRLGPRRKSVLSPSMMPHATSLHGSTYLHHRDQDSPEPKGDTQ